MNGVTENFWEITYKQNIAKLIGVCYRYTYNRQIAEDLAHDAFLVAIDKASSFENIGPFEAWLRRIVVNVALQYLRDQKKQKQHEDALTYCMLSNDYQEDFSNHEENTFSEVELLEAINGLPEHHKLVFNLYVFDNYTHLQIGNELGISEGTSKSHLARARKKIKEILNSKLKDKYKKNRLFFLYLLPDKLWNVDTIFTKRLAFFEIQPQKIAPIHTRHFSNASALTYNQSSFLSLNTILPFGILTCTSILLLQVNSHQEIKALSPVKRPDLKTINGPIVQANNSTIKNNSTTTPTTATFSTNAIISIEKTKHIEEMKPLNTLGALLVAGSAFALDSVHLPKFPQLATTVNNQKLIEQDEKITSELTERNKPTVNKASAEVYGTFYASRLYWSAADNNIYFKGEQVKVSLNSQKFTGSGTFSFLNKVNYLLVNGLPVKLDDTVELSEKKYKLVKLSESDAIKKYGEKGRLGVVEITLAE
ncbi:RNA polymerase sigma factor [Spirosoma sp. BT702]|uniref:RNA polymerase sigma factor n=1 Tax=Spirosoma profusum TaxID=2771354 RepID=A0A926XW57_9BACT|nr:RNA polymerase sigma factor [Spirosoma profusum]MBD2701589.1 RNA polymerase sigma factor [Spirosoma profusum]